MIRLDSDDFVCTVCMYCIYGWEIINYMWGFEYREDLPTYLGLKERKRFQTIRRFETPNKPNQTGFSSQPWHNNESQDLEHIHLVEPCRRLL